MSSERKKPPLTVKLTAVLDGEAQLAMEAVDARSDDNVAVIFKKALVVYERATRPGQSDVGPPVNQHSAIVAEILKLGSTVTPQQFVSDFPPESLRALADHLDKSNDGTNVMAGAFAMCLRVAADARDRVVVLEAERRRWRAFGLLASRKSPDVNHRSIAEVLLFGPAAKVASWSREHAEKVIALYLDDDQIEAKS